MSKGTINIKYTESGKTLTRHTALITERALYHKELMAEEYVLLSFNTRTLIKFKKGDWIETDFGRFEIVSINRPSRNITGDGGWYYEQKFHASWERWKNRKLFYDRQRGSEKAWNMTNLPEHFMQIVCDNIKRAGLGDYTFDVDGTFTELKNLQFDGDDIVAGLNRIAEAWETEWWLEGNHIHLSKCEFGTPVVFEEGDICTTMNRSEGQRNDYVTRLYAFGSDRNIPTNYRKSEDSSSVIEAIVERRLKLPEGTPYIDGWTGMREEDVVEGIVIFDGVYPKRIGNIDSIETHTYTDEVTDDEHPDGELVDWTAYRFKDNGITFKSEYILPDTELHIIFQTGALAGMDFAVTFNPDGENENDPKAQVWEIVRNDNYGVDLPSETFRPQVGDTYVLYGYDTSMVQDILIPAAEQELLIEAQKYLAEKCIDDGVYSCPTNPVRCAGYIMEQGKLTHRSAEEIDLEIGQAVELRSDNYFPENNGKRMSRIRMFEKRLDNKFNATYEVGESSKFSKTKELNDKVESIVAGNITITASTGKGGSNIYLIKRYDGTAPTDYNAYSAKRSDLEFLHRTKPDEAEALIKFLAGAHFGDFLSGLTNGRGGAVDSKGNAELESLRVRSFMEIAELIVNRLSTMEGDRIFTEGDTIEEATANEDGTYTLQLHEEWEGYVTAQYEHNVVKGIFNDITNKIAGEGTTRINNATYYTSWMNVLSVDAANNRIRVALYPDEETPAGRNFPPCAMMKIARWGNSGAAVDQNGNRTEYGRRQTCFEISSSEGRFTQYMNVTKPIIDAGNVALCFGLCPDFLDGVNKDAHAGSPVFYVRQVLAEQFVNIDYLGRPVPSNVFRGSWSEEEEYYDGSLSTGYNELGMEIYERSVVEWMGVQWICNSTGTKDAPSWTGTAWTFYQGDTTLILDFVSDESTVYVDDPRITLSLTCRISMCDLTDDPAIRWDWTRQSHNDGGEDTQSDRLWNEAHRNIGNTLNLTEEDMNFSFGRPPQKLVYTVRATLLDAEGKPALLGGSPLSNSMQISITD